MEQKTAFRAMSCIGQRTNRTIESKNLPQYFAPKQTSEISFSASIQCELVFNILPFIQPRNQQFVFLDWKNSMAILGPKIYISTGKTPNIFAAKDDPEQWKDV
jgi:hypothetical protein